MNTNNLQFQLISRAMLESIISLSRSSIYDRLNPKSKRYDPTFPKPIKFGHSTRWRLSEVSEWIESKAAARKQSDLTS